MHWIQKVQRKRESLPVWGEGIEIVKAADAGYIGGVSPRMGRAGVMLEKEGWSACRLNQKSRITRLF